MPALHREHCLLQELNAESRFDRSSGTADRDERNPGRDGQLADRYSTGVGCDGGRMPRVVQRGSMLDLTRRWRQLRFAAHYGSIPVVATSEPTDRPRWRVVERSSSRDHPSDYVEDLLSVAETGDAPISDFHTPGRYSTRLVAPLTREGRSNRYSSIRRNRSQPLHGKPNGSAKDLRRSSRDRD